MRFDLFQSGPDDGPNIFKLKMQAYNIGAEGDELTINRFVGDECQRGATTVVDGGIYVKEHFGMTGAKYRSNFKDLKMCDFGSIQLADSKGKQLACCNV